MKPTSNRGQVLVLFALMLTALLGFAALAIDVSSVYAEVRHERAVADAASLAGASDNYRAGSATVDNAEWRKARTHAMQSLIGQLQPGGALPTCAGQVAPYGSDITNCAIAGTPYYVSIKAPAPSCPGGGCDPLRSVQVTVRRPSFGLTFARLFGQANWNVPVTSVAERSVGANYTFVTLRPPKPSRANTPLCTPNCDDNEEDIVLDGTNTRLTVHGDMGTNTNMVLKAGASAVLDPGNVVYRYDAYKAWSGAPGDSQISSPIPDPGYAYPSPPTNPALIFANEPAARMTVAECQTEATNIPAAYSVNTSQIPTGQVVCYKPGKYTFGLSSAPGVTTIIFTPGVYFFDNGFMPGNNVRVIGGYQPGNPGVALVFPRDCNPDCNFAGNSADLVSLNAGAAYPTGSGSAATAATNWDGSPVETNGAVPVPITLMVQKDTLCVVAPVDSSSCRENQNTQLKLPGSGSLFLFGVQYAPTDNIAITGGSGSNGYLGQIWAWTVQYTGGSNINLTGAMNQEAGVLRIATACSPGASCTNPEAGSAIP